MNRSRTGDSSPENDDKGGTSLASDFVTQAKTKLSSSFELVQSEVCSFFQSSLSAAHDSSYIPTWFPKTITEQQAVGLGVGFGVLAIVAAVSLLKSQQQRDSHSADTSQSIDQLALRNF